MTDPIQEPAGGAPAADPAPAAGTPAAAGAPAPQTGSDGGAPAGGAAAPAAKPGEAAPAAKPGAEILAAPGGEKPPANVPAAFPETWREQVAGEDKKFLKELERFASPKALADSYKAMAEKISKGEFKRPLPENATPEQVAEWRKDNGIPASAKDYVYDLGDGYQIGELDKPVVDDFANTLHDENLPNKTVNKILTWYYSTQEKQLAAQAQHDKEVAFEAASSMKSEWGVEFDANKNSIINFMDTEFAEGVGPNILEGRAADGTKIKNNIQFIRGLIQLAKKTNPEASMTTQTGARGPAAIDDRLAAISKFRKENRDKYFADEKMQAEERDLLEKKSRAAQLGKAA